MNYSSSSSSTGMPSTSFPQFPPTTRSLATTTIPSDLDQQEVRRGIATQDFGGAFYQQSHEWMNNYKLKGSGNGKGVGGVESVPFNNNHTYTKPSQLTLTTHVTPSKTLPPAPTPLPVASILSHHSPALLLRAVESACEQRGMSVEMGKVGEEYDIAVRSAHPPLHATFHLASHNHQNVLYGTRLSGDGWLFWDVFRSVQQCIEPSHSTADVNNDLAMPSLAPPSLSSSSLAPPSLASLSALSQLSLTLPLPPDVLASLQDMAESEGSGGWEAAELVREIGC